MDEDPLKDFVLDGSNHSVQDIVSKLKFIAKVRPHEWMDVTKLQLYEKTYWNSFYRTLFTRSESRNATLEFIRLVFGEAFELAARYNTSKAPFRHAVAKMILDAMEESKTGIANLKESYKEDRMFVSKLETLTSIFDTKVKELKESQARPPVISLPKPVEPSVHTSQPTSLPAVSSPLPIPKVNKRQLLADTEDEQ